MPHGHVDLYKWSYMLTPLLPSEQVLDCFRLAREVRELDMRASPYDLADLGYPPVRIETPEGRAEYVRARAASPSAARSCGRASSPGSSHSTSQSGAAEQQTPGSAPDLPRQGLAPTSDVGGRPR